MAQVSPSSFRPFCSFLAAAAMRLLRVTKDCCSESLLSPPLTLSSSTWYWTSPRSNSRMALSRTFFRELGVRRLGLDRHEGQLEAAQPGAQRLIGGRVRARVRRGRQRLVGLA